MAAPQLPCRSSADEARKTHPRSPCDAAHEYWKDSKGDRTSAGTAGYPARDPREEKKGQSDEAKRKEMLLNSGALGSVSHASAVRGKRIAMVEPTAHQQRDE